MVSRRGPRGDAENSRHKKPAVAEALAGWGREEGIRTLDTLPYTHFPGVLLQPLGHLSIYCRVYTAVGYQPPVLKDCKNSFSQLATEYFLGIGASNGGQLFQGYLFYIGQFFGHIA